MRPRIFVAVCAMAAASLAGCASFAAPDLLSREPFNLQANGIAYVSLGRKGPSIMPVYHLDFRLVGTVDDHLTFYALPENMFHDKKGVIRDGDAIVEVVGHELPPGAYEIYRFGAFTDQGYWLIPGTKWRSTQPFSFSFRVAAGEAVYLGSFQFVQRNVKNWYGAIVYGGGGDYSILEESARDTRKLMELRPEARGIQVVSHLPPLGKLGEPFAAQPNQGVR